MKSYEQFWKLETTPSGSRINFMEDIEFSLGVIGKLLDSIEPGVLREPLIRCW